MPWHFCMCVLLMESVHWSVSLSSTRNSAEVYTTSTTSYIGNTNTTINNNHNKNNATSTVLKSAQDDHLSIGPKIK